MLGLSVAPPGPEEVIKMATAMAMPAAAKARLQDIGQQLDTLNKRREEIAALKAQADAAVLANDKRAVELQQRSDALDARDAVLAARTAQVAAVVAKFERALGEHATTLEKQTP
jgi:chemotaxis protein histidine kinase CheA